MQFQHLVVAADETDAGRSAVRTGLDLAARANARLTIMTVTPAAAHVRVPHGGGGDGDSAILERLAHWLEHDLASAPSGLQVELGCAHGIPSVEICRFAENRRANLLILGRKHRTAAVRMLVGDTADAVARRSQVASLYVPPRVGQLQRILVALDGTERGFVVFRAAAALAHAIGAGLQPVIVEPDSLGDAAPVPSSRTLALLSQLERLATPSDREALARAGGPRKSLEDMLVVRRGEPVTQLLEAAEATAADIVAIGNRRGGPPGPVEGGSIARRFAHLAPQALLAVPL